MKFSFNFGIYLVLATTIAMLITVGGAYRLSVTAQVEEADADAGSRRVLAKLEKLVSAREAVETATLNYIINRSEQDLQRLRQTEADCRADIAQLALLAAGDAEQQRRAAALELAASAMADQQRQIEQLSRDKGVAAAVSFVLSEGYRSREREFEHLVEAMRQREHAAETVRHELVVERSRTIGQITLWSGLLTIALALFAVAVINRQREEIARVNERLDLALHGSRLAIWDADITTGRAYLSESWAEMLGEAPRETFTDLASLLALVHRDDLERLRSLSLDALKGTRPEYHVEHRVRTSSGEWKWILSHGQVVKRDAAGRALRMTGTNADISARKEIERMKDEFISVVSHELRTPLSSIVGSLGLLAGLTDLSAESKTLIRVARDNSQRLVRLINDILDVEKLDSDSLNFPLEPVELEALLATAIQANQGYADQYGVSMILAQSQGPAWVKANADKLMQVMTNLLSNAAKFSPRGARVEVRLARLDKAYRVSVIDPGPGIPEEFKARIFERFAQADSSASRQRGGTGLGLAICKMLIERLGGRIGFVSASGTGSTFYFDLEAQAQTRSETTGQHGSANAA